MIDPRDPDARMRLAQSMDYWHNYQERFRARRREAVLCHAGVMDRLADLGVKAERREDVWANLVQMAAQAHMITLAFNRPAYKVVAEQPEALSMQDTAEVFLNRYTELIDLESVAREVALDSFFGYGVIYTSVGMLPPRAANAVGQQIGPCCWRVSQDNFLYDGTAATWSEVKYMGHFYYAPLNEAKQFAPFLAQNPEGTAALQEYNTSAKTSSKLNDAYSSTYYSPEAVVRLVDVYFPGSNLIVTWPANSTTFSEVKDDPLWVRENTGHPAGPYDVVSHVDIPDNLLPAAPIDSTIAHHFLFNDLAEANANAARSAKVNPIHEVGSERDMSRLMTTRDREQVAVTNIQKIGLWEQPGPRPDQTAYQLATLQMFKEFSGNLDDTLGLNPTASTARQSQLIRSANNARAAEARRRMDRCMHSVGLKLLHLGLKSDTLRMSLRKPLGRGFTLDVSWLTRSEFPRDENVEHYLITVVPYSMEFKHPEQRLQSINEGIMLIFQALQLAMQGLPIDLPAFVEMQASYRDAPELRRVLMDLLPEFADRIENGAIARQMDPNKGVYTRLNQSTQTNGGGLTQAMTQVPQSAGAPMGVQSA